METIVENIVMQLIEDKKITEEEAVNRFYNSDTFIQLTDTLQKNWTEIYELLKREL